eukprot:7116408-Heterocapsa_arctica.AAC.1
MDTGEDKQFRRHLWIRGLPQMIDVGRPLAIDHSSTTQVSGEVTAYADGGASFPADPRLRRSGLGNWAQEGHPLNLFGVVPGVEQTAGRAELYAAVKVLERTSEDVFLIIDNKACVHNMIALADG